MLNKIIQFSIKNKLVIGLFTLALIIWGIYSAKKLPIDAVPDITNNQVQIITLSPSLAAQEVEQLISFPVEQTMATIPEVKEIRSISRFGLSVVTVVFHDDADIYWARQQVGERLVEARNQIPNNIGNPEMAPISTGLGEIYQYVIHAKKGYENKYDAMSLRTLQDWIVRRQLLGTPGIADVNSFGGLLKQYEIAINSDKLRSNNLSIADVFNALEKNNQNTGGSYIDKKPNAYFIRTEGFIKTTTDIEKIIVKRTSGGAPVMVRDIAAVQLGHATQYGALTRNTEGQVVGGIVMMLKGANSSEVIGRVKEKIVQIQKSLPEGVVIEPFLDRSAFVGRAINTVKTNLIEGALIVIFVLVVFLGNIRSGLIVASVIPLAMLFAIALMKVFGVSGNLMSLGAIDFGLIVDGAVIIVEATMHQLVHKRVARLTQEQLDEEVYKSAGKMMNSAAFGQIIILIVYLPILSLVGIEGKMFGPMAQTVSFAILGAFLLSLTYVPMVSALFLSKKISHKENLSDKMMNFFQRLYSPFIQGALKMKLLVVGIAVGLFAISLIIFKTLGGEFIPTLEEGDLAVETRLLTGSSLSQTIDKITQASDMLMKKFPEVKEVIGKIGASEIPTDPMPIEACDITILLKDKKQWTSADNREELAEKMQKELEKIPGISYGFSQPIQLRFNELISGVRQDVGIKIFGEDLEVLADLAKRIGAIVPTVKGAEDLYVEQVTGLPQIVIKLNRDKIAQFGLNVEDVNRTVSAAFAGEAAGIVYEGERRFDMVVRLEKASRQSIEDVKGLFVAAPDGNQIPLEQVAEVSLQLGPNQIQREDAKRRIIVGFNTRGRDISSVVNEMQKKIDKQVKMPPGYFITYGGQFKNLEEANKRLSVAVPVALALILLLLYFTFGSIKYSLLIFTAIPMSAIGGIFALWIRGMPFSISAGVGFIALFGVAVLNGIVLISEFNRLKKEGMTDIHTIILKGTSVRLRPVLMTATVASLGFFPMALSKGSGAEVQKPLATVVIGGLLTATFLTLVVLPVLYAWFEKIKDKTPKPSVAKVVSVLILFFASFQAINAQTKSVINLNTALASALKNNPLVKVGSLDIRYQQQLSRTVKDYGKTNVEVMFGQYNSRIAYDNNFTISQNIPNPGYFKSLIRLSESNIKSSELQLKVYQSELGANTKTSYYQVTYWQEEIRLLKELLAIYENVLKAASLRYKTGETNALENYNAQSRVNEIMAQLRNAEQDYKIELNRLKILTADSSVTAIADTSLLERTIQVGLDSAGIANNPTLAVIKQQIDIAEKEKGVEQARLKPDFSIGYFNQSLVGYQTIDGTEKYYGAGRRFQGGQLGVSIPIFAKAQKEKVKAAEVNRVRREAELTNYQYTLQAEAVRLFGELQKQRVQINYYRNTALPQANLIITQAQKAFTAGEIGYYELTQSLNNAVIVKQEFIKLLNQYNQTVIDIEFIAGIN
ncbi:acriflavine resistance protein B [Niastella vici]|uniref:Acriflavine resistance protein B n=1 Tax=Niastella vici TaxID=1703345 RepID=A0A1V9FKP1_9BACT|nr:CusA/CzcA family heavy metal efflux RND transporter [Niastella vici]OQP58953.1 acriflavine resistance protein B [Niastella vici]